METQISGAEFLARRRRAFLWDQPRVGKTGAAILAADLVLAWKILVVTTASGRGVWRRAFPAWSVFDRKIAVIGIDKVNSDIDVGIVSWDGLAALPSSGRRPDLIILDEDHKACNPETQRCARLYGKTIDDGLRFLDAHAVVRPGDRVWHLSGTPIPHDLGNTWIRMRVSCPERLGASGADVPDVRAYSAFRERYTVAGSKRLSNGVRIPVVFGGRNSAELRQRLQGIYLRRTQEDVGIQPPRYSFMPLYPTAARRREIEDIARHEAVMKAAETGNEKLINGLELGTLRRLTGTIKAALVADAAYEEFDCGVEKLVLGYWHRDVGDILENALRRFGVLRLDGKTDPRYRERIEKQWTKQKYRVFLAQIAAAGESIDLSTSNELWIVEVPFSPKDMSQIAKRITNVNQKRTAFVKICLLAGTIDEKITERLARLTLPIQQVIN